MNVEILVSDNFRREAKKYLKKFRTLKDELEVFRASLLENPRQGDKITEGVYKVRLASKSKGKGKSGGFRIINYLLEVEKDGNGDIHTTVILLSIYDKSETSSLAENQIVRLIQDFERDIENIEPSDEEGKNAVEDVEIDSLD